MADNEDDALALPQVVPEELAVGNIVVDEEVVDDTEPLLDVLKDPLDDIVGDEESVPDTLWLPVALDDSVEVPQIVGDTEGDTL